jgi:hypothetical protein
MTTASHAWLLTLLMAGALALAACGDGADGPPLPVASDRPIMTLTTAELGQLCDWTADRFGGYGKEIKCSDGTRSARESQAECLGDLNAATCKATAGDVEACTNLTLTCASLATIFSNPSCQHLFECQK